MHHADQNKQKTPKYPQKIKRVSSQPLGVSSLRIAIIEAHGAARAKGEGGLSTW